MRMYFSILLFVLPVLDKLTLCNTQDYADSSELVYNYASSDDASDGTEQTIEESTTDFTTEMPGYIGECPSNVRCSDLGAECIDCGLDRYISCQYGSPMNVTCTVRPEIVCYGDQTFNRTMTCQYCYQSANTEHYCTDSTSCRVVSVPRARYQANCTARSETLCLGRRKFYKMKTCNWTSGKRWSTALILSVTVGGFGVDRFYLGLWKEGIGKLFSFGGLGAWTLVDVVLIATGYVGPADGSLYIF